MTHPKTDAIQALLEDGLSNAEVGRRLHVERQLVGRLRHELGIPPSPRQPLTVEEKWRARVREVDGGHLEWTGAVASNPTRTPVMRYGTQLHTAGRIAFRIQHGHDPVGHAKPGCGLRHCVAPAHQIDTADHQPVHTPLVRYDSPADKLAALVVELDGGHLGWTGRRASSGAPMLMHGGRDRMAARVAFEARWGREPVGLVKPACDFAHCLAGDHLDDATSRAAHRKAYAALGL